MIQWFPGHMHKASKEFSKILPQVDVVIEVLDARLPGSSANPMLEKLRGDKPCIKILNKADLSDEAGLQLWIDSFNQQDHVKTLVCSNNDNTIGTLPDLCRKLVPKKNKQSDTVYIMIAGIPNVGKSTLINKLAGRSIAKTGNEAAVTKVQQRIDIKGEISLIDTPGMLWANIENEASSYRLAATGAIRETALELQDVGAFLAEFLLAEYPQRVSKRYQIESLPDDEISLLEMIAFKRGCIASGRSVDYEKVSKLIINDFRSGMLGPICMETPSGFVAEMKQVEIMNAAKLARKEARKEARKAQHRRK